MPAGSFNGTAIKKNVQRPSARLRSASFDGVHLIGAEMEHAWAALAGSAQASRAWWHARLEAARERLAGALGDGDLVLLKGSRGLELEKLLPVIAPEASRASEEAQRAEGGQAIA